jgi:hypothetical protein
MEQLKQFLKNQVETYPRDNTFEINICNRKSDNISDLNVQEGKFYDTIKEYRSYKLSYSQGKYYQDLNQVCTTSCNRNSNITKYHLLERENMDYNGIDILICNKNIEELDIFRNKHDYIIEENYEILTVYLNNNLKINFEIIGDSHQIKISLNLEKNIPNTYFEEYLKEFDNFIQRWAS